MPRLTSKQLTALEVKSAKPGRYGDGGGLYLLVKPTGARFWLLRYKIDGKAREMGLGSAGADGVSLSTARDKAIDLMRLVRAGTDPLTDRDKKAQQATAEAQAARIRGKTFEAVAEALMEAKEAGWRSKRHRGQWAATLKAYAYPHMGSLPVADVETRHVTAALTPIWTAIPETANRVRGRIEAVLDYAKAMGWRTGENPARWRGHVANLLPARGKVSRVKHFPALPWREVGAFVKILRAREGAAARALEFAILTAGRTQEVLGAQWREFDLAEKVWAIPADRMKAGREHRVPLSGPARILLMELAALRPDDDTQGTAFVFPGGRKERQLSQMAMLVLLRRMERADITPHGFRSSFRDWCAEATSIPSEIAEAALAHTITSAVEAAYRRGDLFEKRRNLMDQWAKHCDRATAPAGEVVELAAARAG